MDGSKRHNLRFTPKRARPQSTPGNDNPDLRNNSSNSYNDRLRVSRPNRFPHHARNEYFTLADEPIQNIHGASRPNRFPHHARNENFTPAGEPIQRIHGASRPNRFPHHARNENFTLAGEPIQINHGTSRSNRSPHHARNENFTSAGEPFQNNHGTSRSNRFSHHARNENFTPGGEPGQNNRDGKRKYKYMMGFKKLLELSQKESTEMIILELIAKVDHFENLLDSKLDQDWIVLIILILSKVFSSSFTENKMTIMGIVLNPTFIETLENYVMMMQYENVKNRDRNKFFWKNVEDFFVNLAAVCESLIETIPTKACEFLPKLLKILIVSIPTFEAEQKIHLSDVTKNNFKYLGDKLDLYNQELEQRKLEIKRMVEEEAPPDDFRTLSIYPTCDEILSPSPPFLRKNITEGKYTDVEHYLDVQFRLLKEDFVAPLRQGIEEYFSLQEKGGKRMKISNVYIHKEVVLTSPCFLNDQVGVSLKFLVRDASKLFNANSKRFMHGSLVCFTKDNFANVLFGKILEKDIRNHQLVIGFEPEHNNYELNVTYLMVECKIYFEPYYHVLKALQFISDIEFPMKNYLIDVNNAVEPPNYLNVNSMYTIHKRMVRLFDDDRWPSAEDFKLNPTQYTAFKAALTQKFVVIQGPPGTGKTYLGLEIVKTLLDERNINHWYNKTPILVVCFTNHALDQFLEGLIGTTNRIVRVGGQCKNELLKEFHLMNKRKGNVNRLVGEALRTQRQMLAELLGQIKRRSQRIKEIEKFDSIIPFHHFDIIDEKISASWFSEASKKELVAWLFGGQENRNVNWNTFPEYHAPANRETDEDTDEEDAEESHQDVILDDTFDLAISGEINLLSVPSLSHRISAARMTLADIESNLDVSGNYIQQLEMQKTVADLTHMLECLKDKLEIAKNAPQVNKPPNVNYRFPNHMQPVDRWNLYFYWLRSYQNHLVENLVDLQYRHHLVHKRYTEIRNINDTELMKDMLVIGMTTTGAARLQTTLQALKCRIVVVEEAAEVLESHVTVSLTNHCEHLILIGDHQQLRPSTADYRIERKFNLGISMFERMVLNKIQCNVLGVQHRMHPKIASLIVPHIYPTLENHPSVVDFPPVLGIDPRLFFLHHTNPEIQTGDESKSNLQEAKFLIGLARYLIQNGYKPEDITILAAYSGQMFTLRQERKNYSLLLHDVRISVLDNYQGEESKIILLSLVRNNTNEKIGFLRIENRVCVALSRAKEGFYMMGNMDLLCNNSEIWPKVKETLVKHNGLGDHLTARCQIHPDRVTLLAKAQDFDKVPEGGCNQICGSLLNCGHSCSRICHILDRVHNTTKCKAPCSKVLCGSGHLCPKMCYEECGDCMVKVPRILECGHQHYLHCYINPKDFKCPTSITVTLPCGHETNKKPCHCDVNEWKCGVPCDDRVEPCGHSCIRTCHVKDDPDHIQYKCYKPCEKILQGCSIDKHKCPKLCYEQCPPCHVIMKKRLPNCNHMQDMQCSVNVDGIECIKPCKRKIMTCGHDCKRKCSETCGGCVQIVMKKVPSCGHEVKAKCSEPAKIKDCHGACSKVLPCGHLCKKKCNEVCTTLCCELVEHTKPVFCGHKFKIECHLQNQPLPNYSSTLLQFCREPCNAALDCSHKCSGTCGECAQGRIHTTCMEKCGVPLICGHECRIPCREVCQPCQLKCGLKCRHNKCSKKCGEECTKCQEPCVRKCKHVKCTSKCGDICTVPPCQEPCEKVLPCSHPCVGFCGDPCPPLCRICDAKELTEVFLGYEDEVDARFVLLDECKHIIESKGMETYCKVDGGGDNGINYRRCPRCKTPLTSTQRYSDYVKEAIQDVAAIKRKTGGTFTEIRFKREVLQRNLDVIKQLQQNRAFLTSQGIDEFVSACDTLLKPVSNKNRRQRFDLMIGKTLEAKLTIVQNIGNTLQAQKLGTVRTAVFSEAVTYVEYLFKRLLKQVERITNQEIQDFEREQGRLQRIAQFVKIANSSPSEEHREMRELIYRPIIYSEIYDKTVKAKLEEFLKKMRVVGGLTDQERLDIVRATGLKKGHWYKCPNGHIYAIGECGGAMQVGKCYECGVQIGGTNHTLLADNRHAGEMDDSRHAAWSNTANNMLNFNIDDLQ